MPLSQEDQLELQRRIEAVIPLLMDGKSLRAACREVEIAPSTVLDRVKTIPEYGEQYTRAREIGYKLLADELLEISDEKEVQARHDGEDVRLDLSPTAIARNRLRVDTRKWMLSKMLPKIYGDKVTVGGDPENPVQVVTRIELVPMRANNAD